RAPGAVHELDVRGQQVVDAVLVDRVGVPAADLHDLVVAAGLDGGEDLARQHAPELRVAELVHELHAAAPFASRASATPACTSTRSPGATGAISSTSTRVSSASPCARQRARPPGSGSTTVISIPWSLQVMQVQW